MSRHGAFYWYSQCCEHCCDSLPFIGGFSSFFLSFYSDCVVLMCIQLLRWCYQIWKCTQTSTLFFAFSLWALNWFPSFSHRKNCTQFNFNRIFPVGRIDSGKRNSSKKSSICGTYFVLCWMRASCTHTVVVRYVVYVMYYFLVECSKCVRYFHRRVFSDDWSSLFSRCIRAATEYISITQENMMKEGT